MLPRSLKISNFLAYRAPDPVRFDGIHLACLTGPNGAGKSSLLDAMTWALWGKARSSRAEDLIHMGQQDMYVQFDFEQEGTLYRVMRQRSRKGNLGKLEIFALAPDNKLVTHTQQSARATQDYINRLLRLDYETFIKSAFLQQGKADLFTTSTPAERKQTLSDILGLDQWARYEEAAKTKLKNIDAELKMIKLSIDSIDTELAREPGLRGELERAEAAHGEAQHALARAEIRLKEVEAAPTELNTARIKKGDSERRMRDWKKDLAALVSEIETRQERIAGYERDLTEHETIEQGYAALVAAREADHALGDKLRQLNELDKRAADLVRQLDRERAILDSEVSGYLARIDELERRAALIDPAELTAAQQEVAEMQVLSEQREALNEQITALKTRQAELKGTNDTLTAEGRERNDRITRLQGTEGALCPLCGQPLSEEHRDELIAQLEAERDEKRAIWKENEESIKQIRTEIGEWETQIKAFDRDLKHQRALMEKAGRLQEQYDAAQQAGDELTAAQANLAAVQTLLETDDYAHVIRAELAETEAAQNALGYDADAHKSVGAQIETYREFERRYTQLQVAMSALPAERDSLDGCFRRHETLENALMEEQNTIDAVEIEIARLEVLVKEYQERSLEVARQRTLERQVYERVVNAQQELRALESQRQRRTSLEQRRAQLSYEEGLYDELRTAFSKNGVPALIIDSVIPELEQTTNDLLTRMTDGRMHLKLQTQREKITGGVAETLEIEIADELGTRNYEMYSGGEAFRINFALRVALSQLLARRAGAHLRTLFIDEGFGTQDDDGRNKLVEAINAVSSEFDLILIITHMEDLRDSFPVHIVIDKTPTGSRVAVR